MKRVLSMLLLGSLFAVSSAAAQTTASQTARINIPQILFISFTGDVNFPDVTATDFDNGVSQTAGGFQLVHRGNILHDVTVQADQATFDKDALPGVKLAGDLRYDMNSTGMVSMTVAPVVIVNSAPRGQTTENFEFDILLDETQDDPGLYELPFTFTILPD